MTLNKKITIYDVAKAAGVSRQTVSRVINNRPDVASDTREKIQQVMKEFNYQPSAIAQSLSRQKSNLFGVVTAGLDYLGPSKTLSGITQKAEEMGYGLLLKELASFTNKDVQPLFQWFQSHQVEGILWAAPEIEDNRNWLKDLLEENDIPIIFLTMEKRENVSSVSIDNYKGGRLATEHLIEQGCRKIGHISGPLEWWEARQRKQGWKDALTEAGLSVSDHLCFEGNWSSKSGKKAFLQMIKQDPEIDGVFAGNDQMGLSVLQAVNEMGKKVPDDIKVVGFDNLPESEYFLPPLTSVHQDQQKAAIAAVEELARISELDFQGLETIAPKTILIEPTLIIRRSSLNS
jgi:LacI family transcriptional regulator